MKDYSWVVEKKVEKNAEKYATKSFISVQYNRNKISGFR